jgi:hypothetical protein
MVRQPYVPCYHATYDKMGDLGECVVVAVLLGLLGLGCIGYGVTVMMNTDCSKLRDRILETVFAELITG